MIRVSDKKPIDGINVEYDAPLSDVAATGVAIHALQVIANPNLNFVVSTPTMRQVVRYALEEYINILAQRVNGIEHDKLQEFIETKEKLDDANNTIEALKQRIKMQNKEKREVDVDPTTVHNMMRP